MSQRMTISTSFELFERDFVADVEIDFSPGYAARTYGPPEDCYEGSGPDIDILNVEIYADEPKNRGKGVTTLETPPWLQAILREYFSEGDQYERIQVQACEDYDEDRDYGRRRRAR
jgi:hypothetical protein